jgi:O-methyltransferase involved in polyketide biosynthesis
MTQSQATPFDRISPTALMVAYARQFTDIVYAKELAQLGNVEAMIDQVLASEVDRPMELTVLIEGRYKAINHMMARFNSAQIIELASGLSPRGLVMTRDPRMTFVESDLTAMISCKQHLANQLIGDRANLYFAAIDVASQPSQLPLCVEHLDRQKPVTILCEGLLMYLTFEQKRQVFANIRELLQIHGGVWITPDLTSTQDWNQRWQTDSTLQRFTQKISQLTATSSRNTTFDSFNHIKQFAHEQGFKCEKYSTLDILNQLTCLSLLGITSSTAESLLEGLSIFVLRPTSN